MSLDIEFIAIVIVPVIGLIWAVFTYVVPHLSKSSNKERRKEDFRPLHK